MLQLYGYLSKGLKNAHNLAAHAFMRRDHKPWQIAISEVEKLHATQQLTADIDTTSLQWMSCLMKRIAVFNARNQAT